MQGGMLSKRIHRIIFISSLVIIAIGLPLSRVLISTGQIFLFLNWILEKDYRNKLLLLKRNRSYLIFISIYLIHLLWIFNTSNFDWYLRDVRIKLPLLVIPTVLAGSLPLSKRELKIILYFFIAAVLTGTFFSIHRLISWGDAQHDHRYLSVFIYHIRFAIEIVLAIFFLVWCAFESYNKRQKNSALLFVFITIWLITFLFILQSLTAFILLFITGFYLVFYTLFITKRKIIFLAALLGFSIISGISIRYVLKVKKYLDPPEINFSELPKVTVNGNPYHHFIHSGEIENNHYTKLNICYKELRNEWIKRSEIPPDSLDFKGQNIHKTMLRYLTSKGLSKDSVGVSLLTDRDIHLIEQGVSNYLFDERIGAFSRIYKFFWELRLYNHGDPNAHTVLQRIEYIKTALYIVKNNLWFGTGTGDYKDAYKQAYKETNTSLTPEYQLRAHNQLLTFVVMFGIFAGLWVMFAYLFPFFNHSSSTPVLTHIFFVISFLSFFNEDTLETHVGVSLIALFYSLFIFGTRKENDSLKK